MDKTPLVKEISETKIYVIRDKKIMLDSDLAELYEVDTKVLKQAVRRHINRFPEDFMFQMTNQELRDWRSQIVTSNPAAKKGLRYKPFAFTEQGVAMLSSVLNSERAIMVNIQIMRTFTKIREMLISNETLRMKIESMERKYDSNFKVVFDAIKDILKNPTETGRKIGFRTNKNE